MTKTIRQNLENALRTNLESLVINDVWEVLTELRNYLIQNNVANKQYQQYAHPDTWFAGAIAANKDTIDWIDKKRRQLTKIHG